MFYRFTQILEPAKKSSFEGFLSEIIPMPAMLTSTLLLLMQVEYHPLSSIEKSRAVMVDFFDIWQETLAKKSLPGRFIHVESNFSEFGLSDHYSYQHTAVQYAICLQQLMTAVRG
jgi:hypothetical protein